MNLIPAAYGPRWSADLVPAGAARRHDVAAVEVIAPVAGDGGWRGSHRDGVEILRVVRNGREARGHNPFLAQQMAQDDETAAGADRWRHRQGAAAYATAREARVAQILSDRIVDLTI